MTRARSASSPRRGVVRQSRLLVLLALISATSIVSSVARATPPDGNGAPAPTPIHSDTAPTPAPGDIGGELRPALPPGEGGRRLLDALLFVPRTVVQVAFIASTETVSFLEDQQVIPRARALLGTEDGKIRLTPTFTVASGLRPELGARLTSHEKRFASMVRTSIVDQDTFLTEGRLLLSLGERGQSQLVLEGFQQRNTDLTFRGIGPDPSHDSRNAFLPGHVSLAGAFLERRERLILGAASRVAEDVEVLLSSSFQRRQIDDPRGNRGDTLAATFAPGTVAGAYDRSERFYTEAAVRRDTRAVRGPPAAGLLLEAYLGTSEDARGVYAGALHTGGRIAWFASVVRKTTILNPGFTLDVVEPTGSKSLPFREYAYAPGFRGSDGRVDRVAALAFLDYRWQLIPYLAARLFVDLTTVAPTIASLRTDNLAWAVGGGLDLHSSTTEIGRIGLSCSPGAVQLLFVYGLADRGFGDRQHR